MNKRAIAILGAIFILIVGTLGFIIWKQTSNKEKDTSTSEIPAPPVVPVTIEEPEIDDESEDLPTGNAVKLTDESVVSPILTFKGDGISYFNRQGQLYITDYSISGGTVLLSNKQEVLVPNKSGIEKIIWPAVGNSYMATTGTGLSRIYSVYDPNTATYVDLPPQVKSLDWMPSGNKIMFTWVDSSGKAFLNLADPDTNNYQVLTDLYEPDNIIHVSPNGQTIVFYRSQTTDLTTNKINSVTPDGKIFNTVVADGYNTGVLWSPDSSKFLFTKLDSSRKPTLWVVDLSTGSSKSLGFSTEVTKAVWSRDSQSVIVGVPKSSSAGQSITEDSVYKVNISSGTQNQIDPGIIVDIEDLFLSLEEDVLFFRNAQDNALYYIFL